eukprot:scaffold15365_cov60-Phaeocystis_antarctica.AAC.3
MVAAPKESRRVGRRSAVIMPRPSHTIPRTCPTGACEEAVRRVGKSAPGGCVWAASISNEEPRTEKIV